MACTAPLLTREIDASRGSVLDLLLGDVELDAVLGDSGHGADRDRYYLAAEHVPLLEEHVGDLVAAGVDDEPLDLPDGAVGGMDVLTAAHSYLSGGKGVVGDGRVSARESRPDRTCSSRASSASTRAPAAWPETRSKIRHDRR